MTGSSAVATAANTQSKQRWLELKLTAAEEKHLYSQELTMAFLRKLRGPRL